jgi:hypothetical protein
MKNLGFVAAVRGVVCLLIVVLFAGAAQAQTLRLDVQLLWGTDDSTSPNPLHHPVDAALAKRLDSGPYRWKHYFKVNEVVVEIPVGQTKAGIVMSDQCKLDIKNLGGSRAQVNLHGKGKPVLIHSDSVTKNSLLVLAGDAGNKTAWLVVIRQTKAEVTKIEKLPVK